MTRHPSIILSEPKNPPSRHLHRSSNVAPERECEAPAEPKRLRTKSLPLCRSLAFSIQNDDYTMLVRELPLKKIRTERDHEEALRMSGRLIGSSRKLNAGQSQYLDAIVVLIREYEQACSRSKLPVVTGINVFKHLMAEHAMTQRNLAQLLGLGDSSVPMILAGSRDLTKSHIHKLSRHFGIGVGAFFER